MCFKKKKKGRFVFLCRNECYFSEFRFPTRYILVVITHLNSFMYVTLLVNTYCLQFPFNLAYFRERKKKRLWNNCFYSSKEKPQDDPPRKSAQPVGILWKLPFGETYWNATTGTRRVWGKWADLIVPLPKQFLHVFFGLWGLVTEVPRLNAIQEKTPHTRDLGVCVQSSHPPSHKQRLSFPVCEIIGVPTVVILPLPGIPGSNPTPNECVSLEDEAQESVFL